MTFEIPVITIRTPEERLEEFIEEMALSSRYSFACVFEEAVRRHEERHLLAHLEHALRNFVGRKVTPELAAELSAVARQVCQRFDMRSPW